jgi:hypothetical protein
VTRVSWYPCQQIATLASAALHRGPQYASVTTARVQCRSAQQRCPTSRHRGGHRLVDDQGGCGAHRRRPSSRLHVPVAVPLVIALSRRSPASAALHRGLSNATSGRKPLTSRRSPAPALHRGVNYYIDEPDPVSDRGAHKHRPSSRPPRTEANRRYPGIAVLASAALHRGALPCCVTRSRCSHLGAHFSRQLVEKARRGKRVFNEAFSRSNEAMTPRGHCVPISVSGYRKLMGALSGSRANDSSGISTVA